MPPWLALSKAVYCLNQCSANITHPKKMRWATLTVMNMKSWLQQPLLGLDREHPRLVDIERERIETLQCLGQVQQARTTTG